MKLYNFQFILAVLILSFTDKQYGLARSINPNKNKDLSASIISDIKTVNHNITEAFDDLSHLLNNTKNENNDKSVYNLYETIDKSLISLKEFHNTLNKKIRMFEDSVTQNNSIKQKNLKKRKTIDNHKLDFYNSISLIMLGLLAGGLVGVVFILYYSLKNEDKVQIE